MKYEKKWPLKHIIEVEWIDSAVKGRWQAKAEYEKCQPSLCRTAGYLLVKDEKRIVILQSNSNDGDVCDSMTIPLVCVKHIRRLK